MTIRKLNPTTPGTRHKIVLQKNELSKNNLIKKLIYNVHKAVGRSTRTGHITVWGRGSGTKRLYRNVNFSNNDYVGIVLFTAVDPNRNAFVSLVFDFINFQFLYSLATKNIHSGTILACQNKFYRLKLGYSSTLASIPTGTIISQIHSDKDKSAKYARSAGTFCQLVQKTSQIASIRLPSGQIIQCPTDSYATIGAISNSDHKFCVLGKAGSNRHRGFRPSVRGIAMNPVDHPHGGRTNGGRPSVTPWGKPALGKPTVKKKRHYTIN